METNRDKLTQARAQAMRALARRPRTEHEIRKILDRAGFAELGDTVCTQLREASLLDDVALARDYVVLRAERMGHGPRRLLGDLRRRGVSPGIAQAAWDAAVADGDIDPERLLRELVCKKAARFGERLETRDAARVYNTLLRAGFSGSSVMRALGPLCDSLESIVSAARECDDS